MQATRCSEAQIITVLREAEMGKHTIEALCRAYGISEATFTQRVPGGGTSTAAWNHRM